MRTEAAAVDGVFVRRVERVRIWLPKAWLDFHSLSCDTQVDVENHFDSRRLRLPTRCLHGAGRWRASGVPPYEFGKSSQRAASAGEYSRSCAPGAAAIY